MVNGVVFNEIRIGQVKSSTVVNNLKRSGIQAGLSYGNFQYVVNDVMSCEKSWAMFKVSLSEAVGNDLMYCGKSSWIRSNLGKS